MADEKYRLVVESDSEDLASHSVGSLIGELREISGVLETSRHKENEATMDLGVIVELISTSGATIAIAQGIASWIKRHRGVKLTIYRDAQTKSIKAEIENADASTALAVTEAVLRA